MKKLFTLLTMAVVALAANADPIDAEQAKQIAADFLGQDNLSLVKKAQRTEAKTRRLSAAVAATSPYYIYSRGAGQGYIIIAGDDCMPTILGYTEQGDFDPDNVPEALQDMFDVWTQMVEDAQVNGTNQPKQNEAKQRRATAVRENIAALMTSHWHQTSPYNDRCPFLKGSTTNRAVTGCVATAASQILYYWRKDLPGTLQATTPTYGYGDAPVTESIPKGTELHWDLMKDSYWGGESATVKDAVAEFVFATGAATWLTYGSSTSGNIENIPNTYSQYFGMKGGTVHYRANYGQEGWVKLLYNELKAGRPVMYTGVHPDQGGHAVVVHGYKQTTDKDGNVSDLFYFNFGWGGQSDGYYTVDTSSGMNGFNDYQSALIGAQPKTWNIDVTLSPVGNVYAQRTNNFNVTIQNNSTLSQSGFYLFASTSKSKPSALKDAKSSDTETVISTGQSATLTLSCKPTSTRVWYITLTDANLNVLQQIEVTPEIATAELSLIDIQANGSIDNDTLDGIAYSKFYNDRASVTITMLNAGSIDYEGTAKIDILVLDETTGEWSSCGTKSASNILLPARQTTPVTINVSNTSNCPIVPGKRYCAEISNPWSTLVSKDTISLAQAQNTRAYFVVTGESDLVVTDFSKEILTFKGHWDKNVFETLVKRTDYKTALNYDLTAVEAFADNFDPSVFPCPNALVFAPEHRSYSTANVLSGTHICPDLRLQAGYDFRPLNDFMAWNATLTIGTEVGLWYMVTVPFTAYVPDGLIARRIESHKSTGFTSKTIIDVDTLKAGCTYLVMASSLRNMNIVSTPGAKSVHVAAAPVVNADTAIIGTYIATATPAKAQMLNTEEKQYFEPVEEGTIVEGLRGYFYDEKQTKKFRAYPSILLDPAYVTLAKTIQQAYDILDQYRDSVPVKAYNAYADSIHAAEYEFSHRAETTLTTPTLINAYCQNLLALGEQYSQSREEDVSSYDVNRDGAFDLSDITDLITLYLSDEQTVSFDLDGDGLLTVEDISLLIEKYLGE
ncbi:MAG: C10 family peptidase [Bacteroidaceae bacterium]|nr:C10 family peptidase [Bacteroidaceae bacterium]